MAWYTKCPFIFHVIINVPLVPSVEEVDFVIEILDRIGAPSLDEIERLLESAGHWNSIDRNDFCR